MRRALKRLPLPLGLILLAAAFQSVAWHIAVPAFQGPDESSHFAYVQYLAETGKIPSTSGGSGSVSSEASVLLNDLDLQPLVGNLGARPGWSPADLALWRRDDRSLPRGSRANGSGPNATGQNPPLYYALMSIPYRMFVWLPLLKRLFILRLFNALTYLATIALTWLIAGEVFGRVRWKQTLAAGVVALQPQLAFMSAVINSDNLLIAVSTAQFYACLRLVTRGPSMRRVLVASSITAASILTHGRGLVAVPVLLVALVSAWIRYRPRFGEVLLRASAAALPLILGFIILVLVSGGPASGGSLYGGEVHALNSGSFNVRQFLSSIYQFYFPAFPDLHPRIGPDYGYRQVFINTFYATFGNLEVTFSQRIYDLLQVGSALGLVAFYTACVRHWRALVRQWPQVLVMLSLLVTLLFFLHYVSYRALLSNGGTDPIIVGRYLLPMIALFGLAITFTVSSLPRRAGPVVAAAILGIGLLLSLGGIGITAARFYG